MWQVIADTKVEEFLSQLELPTQSKALNVLKLLREYGPSVREPHSKKITGYQNLFELRTSGQSPVRMFFTSQNQKFYILHAFIKKTDKTPIKELNLAIKRQAQLTNN